MKWQPSSWAHVERRDAKAEGAVAAVTGKRQDACPYKPRVGRRGKRERWLRRSWLVGFFRALGGPLPDSQ